MKMLSVAIPEGMIMHCRRFAEHEVRITTPHAHTCGQLLKSETGLLSVDMAGMHLVVPASHVVWIPPQTGHCLRSHGGFSGWAVYVAAAACRTLPEKAATFISTGLLREAVIRLMMPSLDNHKTFRRVLMLTIMNEISLLKEEPLRLPMPQDERLLRMSKILLSDPANGRSVNDWADWMGVSSRTFSRLFVSETGFSFIRWRQQLRTLAALEKLAAGESVKSVALSLGYDNISAFISMFRRVAGTTPARYFSSQ